METAVVQLKRTLAELLKPPPTPPPGKEWFRVQWFDPAARRLMVERFAGERQARDRFFEMMEKPAGTRSRLEVVERSGGGWEKRSTLKEGSKGTTTRGAPMTPAERAAQFRRLGLQPRR